MTEFTDKESVTVEPADEIGEDFLRVVRTEGHDPSEDETFSFLSLKEGFLAEAQTSDGETVGVERITDSESLGSADPDFVESLGEALLELADEIESPADAEAGAGDADAEQADASAD